MKFPYGLSGFGTLIRENYFYQDRTHLIPVIEDAGRQLLFLRPRRFGKSLLLSMLEHYYDLNRADQFDALFGHLAIGKSPTSLHNQYCVMNWDFSLINSHGELGAIERSIHQHINLCVERCAEKYQLSVHIIEEDAIYSFGALLKAIQASGNKLYLLIDEYDNFANEVMMARKEDYGSLLYGEGLLKTVFKAVKAAASDHGLERVFIAGVSPIVLSDMTSGYNVAKDIYLKPEFNALCGFTEEEIVRILQRMHEEGAAWSQDEALNTMRTFYNGYRFSEEARDSIYNPTLSLYFLDELSRYGRYPSRILDKNLAMDRNKLVYISQLKHGEELLLQALNHEGALAISELADRFGVEDMLAAMKDSNFMISLLYYFGILTQAGVTEYGEMILKVPNLVAGSLYLERLQALWLTQYEDKEAIAPLRRLVCQTGDLQPLCDFIEASYFPILSNRDYRWSNELQIKVMFMTLLFDDNLYMMVSEIELNHRYADLAMILRPDKRKYQALDLLLEFKYLDLSALDLSGEQAGKLSHEELALLPQVVAKLNEAEQQVQDYGATLVKRYKLRELRGFAVVALGLKRVVWRAVTKSG